MKTTTTRQDMRQRPRAMHFALAGLLALAALVGCVAPGTEKYARQDGSLLPQIRPLPLRVSGTQSSAAYYALGRYEYFNGHLERAEAAYRQAMQLDANDPEPWNGLAVLHDRQGRFDLSAAEYQAALALAPNATHIIANLGYSLLMQGRATEAITPLRRATTLAPEDSVARAHLARAESAVGIPSPPTATTGAAAGVPLGASPATAAAVRSSSVIASIHGAEARPPTTLRDQFAGVRIEIANGNGVTGVARGLRTRLRQDGLQIARTTNALPYDKRQTLIICSASLHRQAETLAQELAVTPRVIIGPTRHLNVDLRLILGADFVRSANSPAVAPQKLVMLDQ